MDGRTPTSSPLRIGPLSVWPPVVLAPMAGVTNTAFRRLCRRFGGGLYVSEMVNARGLVEGGRRSWELASFDADETPRSIQLYGTDPWAVGEAVRQLVGEGQVDHVDLNLGCPVRKVTRHGGGAALPARPRLLAAVLASAVAAAGEVPVTVKMRTGLDQRRLTHLEAGRIAAAEGAAAVALHARTAEQHYSGQADWSAIAELVAALEGVPVLGNGDIWTASDAVRMMGSTGCHGVVVGRGCLGRPWLFADLQTVFEGGSEAPPPRLGRVAEVLAEHLRLLAGHLGEQRALQDVRKHVAWYLLGYPVGGPVRRQLMGAPSIPAFEEVLDGLDPRLEPLPGSGSSPRGKQDGPHPVTVPEGWVDAGAQTPPIPAAELATSGG